MKLIESEESQNKCREAFQELMEMLKNEEASAAVKYAVDLKELTRLRNLAKSGWRPDFPKGKGKFSILRQHVYVVNLGPVVGSEQDLVRPCIVLRTNSGNTAIVIPLTDEHYGDKYPEHVDLTKPFDKKKPHSTALLDQMRTVDKRRILQPHRTGGGISRIDDNDMMKIRSELARLHGMDLDAIGKFRLNEAKQGLRVVGK